MCTLLHLCDVIRSASPGPDRTCQPRSLHASFSSPALCRAVGLRVGTCQAERQLTCAAQVSPETVSGPSPLYLRLCVDDSKSQEGSWLDHNARLFIGRLA